MITDERIKTLPAAIVERGAACSCGCGASRRSKEPSPTCAALLISLLGIMAVDWAFNVSSQAVRWLLSLTAAAITLYTLWRCLLRPLSKRITYTRLARWVESHHPEMEERISTAVELTGRGDAGSHLDRRSRARSRVGCLAPQPARRTFRARRWYPTWTAGVSFALLAALFALFPKIAPMLFARAVAPYANMGNAYAGSIRTLTDDKQIVTAGDSFNVEAAYSGAKDQRAVIILTYPDGTEVREQMNDDPGIKIAEDEDLPTTFRFPTQPPTN